MAEQTWTPPRWWREFGSPVIVRGVEFVRFSDGDTTRLATRDGRAIVTLAKVYSNFAVKIDGTHLDPRPRLMARALELAVKGLRAADRAKAEEAAKPKRARKAARNG